MRRRSREFSHDTCIDLDTWVAQSTKCKSFWTLSTEIGHVVDSDPNFLLLLDDFGDAGRPEMMNRAGLGSGPPSGDRKAVHTQLSGLEMSKSGARPRFVERPVAGQFQDWVEVTPPRGRAGKAVVFKTVRLC